MSAKLTDEQFWRAAITKLRTGSYKGINARYSGANKAFQEYFGKDADPVASSTKLMAEGKLYGHPSKGGGFMLYLPEDGPQNVNVLAKILG